MRVQLLVLVSVMVLLSGCASTRQLSRTLSHQSTKPPVKAHTQDSAALMKIQKHSTQVSRYSTIKNVPESAQTNPLLAVASFNFPPNIKTVGQAIDQVMVFTGYAIAKSQPLAFVNMRTKALPRTNRHLGPMSIEMVLLTLAGSDVFELERDPLHRTLTFIVKPQIYAKWSYRHD